MEGDSHQRVLRRLRRSSELRRHWCSDEDFATTFREVIRGRFGKARERDNADAAAFLDNVVARIVVRPADLLSLCAMLCDERLAREFMRFYVRHELADHDVLFALVESRSVFGALPDDPEWMEVAVLLYGSAKLNEGGKLTIAEIAPLGIDIERSTVRSLVGTAFDSGMLVQEDCDRLLELFPDDAYFRAKLAEGRDVE